MEKKQQKSPSRDVSIVHFREAVLIKGQIVNTLDHERHDAKLDVIPGGVECWHKGKHFFVPNTNIKSIEFID